MIGWFLERVNSLTGCHLLLTVISSPWYPRAVGQSAPVLLLRNQTSVVTFHPLNNQLFLSLCLLEKQLFKRTMKRIFSYLHHKITKQTNKNKTPVCERMAGLGVDFFFLENIIYFCAILNVFVDCCFSFCLFFF